MTGTRADAILERMINAESDTATVSTLGYERENDVVRSWNEGCHLRSIEATP